MTIKIKTWTNGADFVNITDNNTYIYKFLDGNDQLLAIGNGANWFDMGTGNDSVGLRGDVGGNTVLGGLGNDLIDVKNGGHDSLTGGDGDDVIISETLYVQSGVYQAGDDIYGGAGNDSITVSMGKGSLVHGGDGNDRIVINSEHDGHFHGDAGDDTFEIHTSFYDHATVYGGTGNDNYYFTDAQQNQTAAAVVEQANEGSDTVYVRADMDFSLASYANVENLIALNSDEYTIANNKLLMGNALNNHIVGSQWGSHISGEDGDDFLQGLNNADKIVGGFGRDVIQGNGGDDVLYGESSIPVVSNGERDDDDIYGGSGNDQIWGGHDNDLLDGGTGNDKLYGDSGNDTLNGGIGADSMTGGTGDDAYVVDNTADKVNELSGAGYDTVYSSLSSYTMTSNVERLELKANSAASGYGNVSDNSIVGNDYSNGISGNAGADALWGNGGNDKLYGGDGNDFVWGGDGSDMVYGGNGNDQLDGGIGIDQLFGDDGNDRLSGGSQNDLLFGGDGADTMQGDAGNDQMNGGMGNDSLIGGDGSDYLYGAMGQDVLTGGAGADQFVFSALTDSFGSGNYFDKITDFTHGADKIDLHLIDASTTANGNQTFSLSSNGKPLFASAGDLWCESGTNGTTDVYGDVNGDGVADIHISVFCASLTGSDFYL